MLIFRGVYGLQHTVKLQKFVHRLLLKGLVGVCFRGLLEQPKEMLMVNSFCVHLLFVGAVRGEGDAFLFLLTCLFVRQFLFRG